MATALALTPNPATGSCLLQITGAPVPSSSPYVLNSSGNYLKNPSAEIDVSDWLKTAGNTLVRDTTPAPQSGSGIFKWTTSAIGDWAYTGDYAAAPGEVWTSSAYVQGGGSVTIRVTWRDSALNAITGGESSVVTLTGAWQRISVTATAPAGAAYVFLRIVQKTAGALTVSFDACMLAKSATLDPYTEIIDGWAPSNGTIAVGVANTGPVGFLLHANALDGSDFALAAKTISGLTIGVKYRMTAWFKRGANSAEAALGVSGIGVTTSVTATSTWQQIEYVFTATATSHTLQCFVRGNSGYDTQGDVYFDDIRLDAVNAAYTPTTITRVDANGSHPVRLLEGQEPISGSMTVTDYEIALTGSVRYDVLDSAGVTTSASTSMTGVTNPWLHAVVLPSYRADLDAVKTYSAERSSNATVHNVISRTDPVVVVGTLRLRTGNMSLHAPDYATALALVDIANTGEVMMVRQIDYAGMDMYFVATSATVAPDYSAFDGWRWRVDLDYVEVAVPTSPLMGGAGWTFASVISTYSRFIDVRTTFATFADLVVGP